MSKKNRKPSEASQIADVLRAKPEATNEEVIAELGAKGVDVKDWQVKRVREKLAKRDEPQQSTQQADSDAAPATEAETAPSTEGDPAASESQSPEVKNDAPEVSPEVNDFTSNPSAISTTPPNRENVTEQRKRQPTESKPAKGPHYCDPPKGHEGIFFPN